MPTTYRVKLLDQKEIAAGTHEFTMERPAGFDYRAGQYGDILLFREDGSEDSANKHGFSMVSAPFEDTVKMATRMRPSAFKNAIRQVENGSTIGLIGVWGDFTLQKNEQVPAVFVIGGIGITPVLSIVKQATHDKTQHKITLIYANHSRERAAYIDELQALEKANPNFKLVTVFSDRDGHVNAETLKHNVDDMAGSRFYLAGPEGMVRAMRQLLIDVGADEDNIKTEEFEGY